MEELYEEDAVEDLLEDDEISASEEGFMRGYDEMEAQAEEE